MAYDLYPAVDPSYNFPPEVRAALATSTELRNTVVPMTTTLRNNLTAGEKWDGRLILNTTTDRLERWDMGLAGWQQIADILDLAPYTAALLQRPGRNRIINGDFAVNQRAFVSTTAEGFGFDRWVAGHVGGTVTHLPASVALGILPESATQCVQLNHSGQAATGDYSMLTQRIESVKSLSAKTVTISFWAVSMSGTPKIAIELEQFFGTGGSPSSTVDTYFGQVTLSASWARYSVTATLPSISGKTLGTAKDDYLRLNLFMSAGSLFNARLGSLGIQNPSVAFWGVQVEEGSVATPFEVDDYATNLRRCQRYYWELPIGPSYAYIPGGISGTSTTTAFQIPHPVPMRTAVAQVVQTGTAVIQEPSTNVWTVTSLTHDTASSTTLMTSITMTASAGAMTPSRPAFLRLAAGARFSFSAEL